MSEKYKVVHEERNAVQKVFQEKWNEAEENKRFVRMLQYSTDQLGKFNSGGRVPYVMDFITQPLNTYVGDQRDSRTDIKYLPTEQGDEIRCELLNAVKDTVLRQNRWVFLESDIFVDGIIEKAGAVGYEWSTVKNPLGSLNMFRVPIRQLTWDVNRREFDLEQSSWVSRTRLYSKRQLIAKYPEFEEEIKTMSLQGGELDDLKLSEDYFKTIIDTDLSAVALIEFYERKYVAKYFVTVNGETIDGKFKSKREAEYTIAQLKQQREQEQANTNAGQIPDVQYDVITRMVPYVCKSEVASNLDFVADEEQEAPFFPYDVYYPFWEDGEYWSVIDLYKDSQRFINKVFSMVDHQIATGSKGLLFIDESIPEQKAKAIMEGWSKAGGAFRVKNPNQNILHVKPDSFDPKLLEAMQVAIINIEKKAGGANYLGRRESSAESGVAVERRTERASVASFMIYDNLDRFKQSVGYKVAWYISNLMTAQQKIRIEGEALTKFAKENYPPWLYEPSKLNPSTLGYMEINSGDKSSFEDLTIDVIVDKSAHAASKNREMLGMLQQIGQAYPTLAESMPPQMLIALLDLPASLKQEMMQGAQQLMQAKMEQAKAEANKPPTLSMNFKDIALLADNPDLQAQALALFGLKMGPNGQPIIDPAADEAKQKEGLKILTDIANRQTKREQHDDKMSVKLAELHQNDAHHNDEMSVEEKKIEAQKEAAKRRNNAQRSSKSA